MKKHEEKGKQQPVEDIKKAEYNIKIAFFGVIIFVILSALFNETDLDIFGVGMTIVLFGIFAFGIYKKSRVASISVFVLSIVMLVLSSIKQGLTSQQRKWGIPVIFGLFLITSFKGIQGTFLYHKLINTKKLTIREIILAIFTGFFIIFMIFGWLLAMH